MNDIIKEENRLEINRNYKSSVFTTLFGTEEKILELYSAIEGKSYPKEAEVKINTLQNALFLDRLNDVSFTIEDKLVVLIEHQSTINANMPLRALLYIARLYEQMIESKSVYRKDLVKIPTPEFIVLYNGTDEYPDKQTLKLSDAFKARERKPELELTVKVFNINKGRNEEIAKRSKTLRGYAFFIDRIRENIKSGMDKQGAIVESVRYCIANNILRSYLEKYGAEVANMLFVEFNMDDALRIAREEGLAKGLAKGLAEGKAEGKAEQALVIAKNMLNRGNPIEVIVEDTGLTHEEVEALRKN